MSAGSCSEAARRTAWTGVQSVVTRWLLTVGTSWLLATENPNQILKSVSTPADGSGPVTFGTQVLRWWLFRPS